eukprot:1054648-Pyramimonas_sp.AAC.1
MGEGKLCGGFFAAPGLRGTLGARVKPLRNREFAWGRANLNARERSCVKSDNKYLRDCLELACAAALHNIPWTSIVQREVGHG